MKDYDNSSICTPAVIMSLVLRSRPHCVSQFTNDIRNKCWVHKNIYAFPWLSKQFYDIYVVCKKNVLSFGFWLTYVLGIIVYSPWCCYFIYAHLLIFCSK